jgi:hypothetical protein
MANEIAVGNVVQILVPEHRGSVGTVESITDGVAHVLATGGRELYVPVASLVFLTAGRAR